MAANAFAQVMSRAARSLPNVPPGGIQEELWHAVDATEQVRRLRRHHAMLTGRQKTAIVCSRLYEEDENYTFPAARACM
jgi:hypothetical protein